MTPDELSGFIETVVKQAVNHGVSEVRTYQRQDQEEEWRHAVESAVRRAVALVVAELTK